MTPLAKLREELLKFLPHVDIIREDSGELAILTRLTLDRDDLVPIQISHNERIMREALTDSYLHPFVDGMADDDLSSVEEELHWEEQ